MTDGELNTKFENLENCQDELKTKSNDMVNWKTFVWIMGTLVTIAIAIIGWRINVTNVLANKLDANNTQFAIIQTQLSEIKIQQAEIMKDIQWMKQR
jgi:hypothetical protein